MKKEISSRQFGCLLFVSMVALKLTFLPTFMYKFAKIDAIFLFLTLILIDLVSFAFVFRAFVKNPDTSFSEFLEKRIGKVFSKIIYLLIFIFFLIKIIFLSSAGFYFIREAIFQETTLLRYILISFSILNCLYLFKLNAYSRTVEYFIPVIIFGLFVCVILGMFTTKKYDLFPLFTTSPTDFFNGVYSCIFCFGDYIFMLPLMGKVKIDKKFYKKTFLFMGFAIVLLFSLVVSFYSFFKYTCFAHNHAITDIIEFVPLSDIIENLDFIPTSIMLFLFIFQSALFMFCLMTVTKNLFKFKTNYDNRWLLIPVNVLLLCLIFFVFNSTSEILFYASNYFSLICAVVICVVSITVFVLSFIKTKKPQPKSQAVKMFDYDLKWISEMQKFGQIHRFGRAKSGVKYEKTF